MLREKHGGYPTYWPCGVRCIGGVTLIRALLRNLGTWQVMLRERHKRRNREAESTDASGRGGLLRISDETAVMAVEQRERAAKSGLGQLATG